MSQSTYCSRHPNTETNLRCGKCEVPLCPQCMVHTPVGVRCQECARVRRLPTFEVTTPFLARAIGAGIGLGIVGGVAVRVFSLLHIFPLLNAIAIVAVGYLVGAGNKRRRQPQARPEPEIGGGGVYACRLFRHLRRCWPVFVRPSGSGRRDLRRRQPLLEATWLAGFLESRDAPKGSEPSLTRVCAEGRRVDGIRRTKGPDASSAGITHIKLPGPK